MTVIGLFLSLVFLGVLLPVQLPPAVLLLIWDGLVVAFLFSWSIGLLTELAAAPEGFVAGEVLASAGIAFWRVFPELSQLAVQPDLAHVRAVDGRPGARSRHQPRAGAAAALAADGVVLFDGDGTDVSVSRLAGVADGQQAAAADDYRGGDVGVHRRVPGAQPGEFLFQPGAHGPTGRARQKDAAGPGRARRGARREEDHGRGVSEEAERAGARSGEAVGERGGRVMGKWRRNGPGSPTRLRRRAGCRWAPAQRRKETCCRRCWPRWAWD